MRAIVSDIEVVMDTVRRLRIRSNTKQRMPVIGMVNGCLDATHAGHAYLLGTASGFCDHLIVAINSDEYCKRVKGPNRPLLPWQKRAEAVLEIAKRLPCDVHIVQMLTDTPQIILTRVKPDIYVIGKEYQGRDLPGTEACRRVLFIDRLPGVSTTEIIKSTNPT